MTSNEDSAAVEPTLLIDVVDGVHVITLNRPKQMNAVTIDLLIQLNQAIDEVGPLARVIVLTGAGHAFSSGADLGNLEEGAVGQTLLLHIAELMTKLRDIKVPVLAAVPGPAAGVGCLIALICDYVVMAEDAYFLLPFTKIGLLPDGGATALVAASIGRHRALRMALTAEKVPAVTAREWGLAAEVTAGPPLPRTLDVASRFAASATLALGETKHAINAATLAGLEQSLELEAAGLARLHGSHDFTEGVSAFREKRRPEFTGS